MRTSLAMLVVAIIGSGCGPQSLNQQHNGRVASRDAENAIPPVVAEYDGAASLYNVPIKGTVEGIQRFDGLYTEIAVDQHNGSSTRAVLYVCETANCFGFAGANIGAVGLKVGQVFEFTPSNSFGSYYWGIMTASKLPTFQHPINRYDVNGDGCVTHHDSLILNNYKNRGGRTTLPETRAAGAAFVDLSGDGYFTARDLLMMTNYLNRGNTRRCYR